MCRRLVFFATTFWLLSSSFLPMNIWPSGCFIFFESFIFVVVVVVVAICFCEA
jgi:hypothetical protein